MAVSKGDQFFAVDPAQPPRAGTALKMMRLPIADVDNNHIISPNSGDLVGGLRVTAVWVNDTIRVNMGQGPVTVVGVTFYRQGGPALFTPTDGTLLQNATLISASYVLRSTQVSETTFGPPCFTHGTMMATPRGGCAVQDLRAGDLVTTRDHGPQILRWVGQRAASGMGRFAPIHFLPGALGNARDLLVSPQHRMLISGWQAEVFFGEPEVLVAAKHLVNGQTVVPFLTPVVEYFHLLFNRHEIVFAEGAATESFYPGKAVLASDRDIYTEMTALFPALADASQAWSVAQPVISGAEAAVLRHQGLLPLI